MKEHKQDESIRMPGTEPYLPKEELAEIERRRQERMRERVEVRRQQIIDVLTRR